MSKLEYRFGGPGEKATAPKPSHKVVETENAVYIDDFEVGFIVEGSVKVEKLPQGYAVVQLSFIAASYEIKS
ncbi:hypothetical protein [Enterococcus sp. AZ147]|uniref:hypothetical protein n=1 Tax=Enterococcus sp. AZ147 TaxID=2774769 RepID=UPI003F291898